MSQRPLVSICCITFNHEKYIRDAIEGFLMQKTSFPIEIIIHDDASTDRTATIVREYEEKFPDIFKPIYQTENQWSKGIKPSPTYVWPKAKGKYIALCEGDDYWTDPYKLQKQVDFLENNPEYAICLHNTLLKFEESEQEDKIAIQDPKEELSLYDFIDIDYFRKKKGLISRGHTSSIVIKNQLVKSFPDWFTKKALSGDIYLLMLVAQYGKGKFLNECMSVYRINRGGITRAPAHRGHILNENRILILHALNKEFNFQYDQLIRSQVAEFYFVESMNYSNEKSPSKAFFAVIKAVKYSPSKLKAIDRAMNILSKRFRLVSYFWRGVHKVRRLSGALVG